MAIYKSKKPTKDGRQYFFRIKYKDIFGEYHDYSSQKFKTKKEAETEEALYKIKVLNQKTNTSNITIDEIFKDYIENKKKKVKKQTIIKDIALYIHLDNIKNYKINKIDLNTYKKFVTYLNDLSFTSAYKNKILGLLKRLVIYSNKYYNTSDSILRFIENFKEINQIKKEMDFFTYEEYKKFDSVINNFELHTFFETLYYLGLRQGECCALTWKDIDFTNKTISVNKTITTKIKGEKWTISSPKTKTSIRILPIPITLLNDLNTMHYNAKQYIDYKDEWFVFGNTRPFAETTIQKKKNDYCKKAELKQIRIHDFRHSCASLLINKGASIALVSKYLGHSNITITLNTYTHMYKSELEDMTNILNNL